VAVWTMDYWVRVLPGILACATLNGIVAIASGHALNQPAVPVGRAAAVLATLALGLSAVLATGFQGRPLTKVDRIACLGILASFATIFSPSRMQALGLAGVVICATIAWVERRRHTFAVT
jgi:hypothetical protein